MVFLARDLTLGKLWAVKVRKKEDSLEGRILLQLQHSGIPQLVDRWEKNDTEYLVMEYISGENLKKYFEGEEITEEKLLPFVEQLCQILSYLHSRTPPVIHGDIKPENILITEGNRVYLIDFGSATCGDFLNRTQKGTLFFAAPEQKQGKAVPQTDFYCLGETLAFLLDKIKRPSRTWKRILKKCRNKRIALRYQTAGDLLKDFQKIKKRKKSKGRLLFQTALLAFVAWGSMGTFFFGRNISKKTVSIIEESKTVERIADQEQEKYPQKPLQEIQDSIFWMLQEEKDAGFMKENISWQIRKLQDFLDGRPQEQEQRSALFLLGSLYEMQREDQKAGEIYLLMAKEWPKEAECAARYGLLLLKEGKKAASRRYFENVAFTIKEKSHNYKIWERKLKEEEDEKMD